jgi:hypothetical protein
MRRRRFAQAPETPSACENRPPARGHYSGSELSEVSSGKFPYRFVTLTEDGRDQE